MDSTIKVWDIATLQCLQTLTEHTEVVTLLPCWDQFLLSCSPYKTIKLWATAERGKLFRTLLPCSAYRLTRKRLHHYCVGIKFLLSHSLDKTIMVWVTAESGKLKVVCTRMEEQVIFFTNLVDEYLMQYLIDYEDK